MYQADKDNFDPGAFTLVTPAGSVNTLAAARSHAEDFLAMTWPQSTFSIMCKRAGWHSSEASEAQLRKLRELGADVPKPTKEQLVKKRGQFEWGSKGWAGQIITGLIMLPTKEQVEELQAKGIAWQQPLTKDYAKKLLQ